MKRQVMILVSFSQRTNFISVKSCSLVIVKHFQIETYSFLLSLRRGFRLVFCRLASYALFVMFCKYCKAPIRLCFGLLERLSSVVVLMQLCLIF